MTTLYACCITSRTNHVCTIPMPYLHHCIRRARTQHPLLVRCLSTRFSKTNISGPALHGPTWSSCAVVGEKPGRDWWFYGNCWPYASRIISVAPSVLCMSRHCRNRHDTDGVFFFTFQNSPLSPSTLQIAGFKTAGAKIWGPLTNVITPQKLFLFLLFQARLPT